MDNSPPPVSNSLLPPSLWKESGFRRSSTFFHKMTPDFICLFSHSAPCKARSVKSICSILIYALLPLFFSSPLPPVSPDSWTFLRASPGPTFRKKSLIPATAQSGFPGLLIFVALRKEHRPLRPPPFLKRKRTTGYASYPLVRYGMATALFLSSCGLTLPSPRVLPPPCRPLCRFFSDSRRLPTSSLDSAPSTTYVRYCPTAPSQPYVRIPQDVVVLPFIPRFS